MGWWDPAVPHRLQTFRTITSNHRQKERALFSSLATSKRDVPVPVPETRTRSKRQRNSAIRSSGGRAGAVDSQVESTGDLQSSPAARWLIESIDTFLCLPRFLFAHNKDTHDVIA